MGERIYANSIGKIICLFSIFLHAYYNMKECRVIKWGMHTFIYTCLALLYRRDRAPSISVALDDALSIAVILADYKVEILKKLYEYLYIAFHVVCNFFSI